MHARFKRIGPAVALVFSSCATGTHPITPSDILGGGPALETTLLVRQECSVSSAGRVFLLPVGDYRPTQADSHGVFYESPTGITEQRGDTQRTVSGGIHFPNSGGKYYSFLSMWIASSEGDPAKLPLPDQCWNPYGATVSLTRNGHEIAP